MEAVYYSYGLANIYQTTRRHTSEEDIFVKTVEIIQLRFLSAQYNPYFMQRATSPVFTKTVTV
jgi:hypothetical protein